MTPELAAEYIYTLSGINPRNILDGTYFDTAYERAAIAAHPDRPGGSDEAFERLQKAREVLERGT